MKIINLNAAPRYFSYATQTSGGVVLASGASSRSVPLSRIFDPMLQKDLKSGIIKLCLEPADKEIIDSWLKEDAKPVVVKQLPVQPALEEPAKNVEPTATAPADQPAKPLRTRQHNSKKAKQNTEAESTSVTVKPEDKESNVIADNVSNKKPVDLATLFMMNAKLEYEQSKSNQNT